MGIAMTRVRFIFRTTGCHSGVSEACGDSSFKEFHQGWHCCNERRCQLTCRRESYGRIAEGVDRSPEVIASPLFAKSTCRYSVKPALTPGVIDHRRYAIASFFMMTKWRG